MLDSETLALVRSTLPAIANAGPAVAKHFYQRMLSHNPELKNVFNMSNQVSGRQPEALFAALCAYGSHLDNPAALLPAVEKIAQKHASLSISPDQYAIVGEHLLGTIRELLNPGDEVLAAWAKAYGALADIFIGREAQIYQEHEHKPGGWRGTRRFVISDITQQSEVIKSIVLTPQDGKPVADYVAGQYLAVYLQPEGFPYRQIRQYSLTRTANGNDYRIAVRHQPGGKVSGWLHEHAKCGDLLEIAVPGGDFVLDRSLAPAPLTLISAGVGLTPLLAMLHSLAEQSYPAEVNWWHAAENPASHAFRDEVSALGEKLEHFRQLTWYNHPAAGDNDPAHFSGLMDLSQAGEQQVSQHRHYYLCGPAGFMQSVFNQLTAAGVSADHIHYEMFGPHQSL
ncbi:MULTISPECIES: NO-inducible flavohemoprotein [Tatumella]|uniref:Flavohemoprotein n=1 Tax=Tatumella punctata TaxID=399969 RepID=A0ABW1VPL2_9GAMM|nr:MULTISPECIES: NO-inducible flavohemoprotein [unclassified Tatumella]MBS0856957.1 NO-inducible flavohemoprotein [Tatumella sp. JGM16]MBS0893907.1 NO-inducible flavohemoprotein [Tatumella sp. JGM130]MBS0913700.1 NO-inducible flavohemoprotein [Tatumella sp. JGM91]